MTRNVLILVCIVALCPSFLFSQEEPAAKTDSSEESFWKRHNVNFAGIPMINYDPSFEWNFAALANAFFRVAPSDTISPLSMAGAILGYTTNGTWYWSLYTKMYLDEDNYRATIGFGDASVNFQYYEELAQSYISFNSFNNLFLIELQRRVYKRWYLGLRYVNRKVKTKYEIEGQTGDPEKQNISNIGFIVSHDTRDFIYNPYHGDYMNFRTKFFRDQWGSDYNYTQYEFDYTNFFYISDTRVVAGRVTARIATGDVPFEGQYVISRENIRGYTTGKHRGEQAYDIRAEYRWNFYNKWGMVAFGAVATAVNDINEIKLSGLLPGVGVGIRYMAVPSEKINIGIDVAVGRDDWGLYFRIGEVFGDK